jgi:predicted AAA+ superfamily ATPase
VNKIIIFYSLKSVIQVTWELNDKHKEREIEGAVEALLEFKQKTGLILTFDQEEEINRKNKRIIIKSVWK